MHDQASLEVVDIYAKFGLQGASLLVQAEVVWNDGHNSEMPFSGQSFTEEVSTVSVLL